MNIGVFDVCMRRLDYLDAFPVACEEGESAQSKPYLPHLPGKFGSLCDFEKTDQKIC